MRLLDLLSYSAAFRALYFRAAGEIGCKSRGTSLLLHHVNFSSSPRPLSWKMDNFKQEIDPRSELNTWT